MLDISRISNIDIKTLSEDETDNWCLKILKLNFNESEVDKSDLLTLFNFTRSLLNVKHIQTDVLLEELQNIEQKFEDIQNELDSVKQKSSDYDNLHERINELEKELREAIQQRHELTIELEQKDRELQQLRSQMPSSANSSLEPDRYADEMKIKLKEKNEQIEQLLDKLYDSDRINLDLAEKVAKLRVDLSKSENDNRLLEARCQILEKQIKELESLNETLIKDRERRDQEVNRLREELEDKSRSGSSNEINGSADKIDFYQQMTKEIERLNALLVVKETEIMELREMIHNNSDQQRNIEDLSERSDQIERLEEELSILSEGLVRKVKNAEEGSEDIDENEISQIKFRKLNRRIRKLKKQIQTLQLRNDELEEEARRKDEELARQRKRMSMLIGGDDRVKKLLEENSVLNRMVRSRDNRIEFLINQLNKHQLIPDNYSDSSQEPSSLCIKQEIELRDQLIAVTVERDVLQRQIDVIKTHLESVHNENLELQMGMKEILESIRQSEASTDLVLECPSLERVCRLLENRNIYFGLNGSAQDSIDGADLTQIILLKSELDHVRGQNEQLRNELKNLRADFLSVIDEYTTDILDNWTIGNTGSGSTTGGGSSSLSDLKTDDNVNEIDDNEDHGDEDEGLVSSEDLNFQQQVENVRKKPHSKSNRPTRSRSQRKIPRNRFQSGRASKSSSKQSPSNQVIETIDVGVDPIQEWSSMIDKKTILTSTKSIQTDNVIDVVETLPKQSETEVIPKQKASEQEHQIPEVVHLAEEDDEEDSYVLMRDVAIQTINHKFDFKSTQTETFVPEKTETKQSECLECAKNLSMLDSVQKLIEKERQHFRLQETKQSDLVKSLKQNLRLVKKEYQLDIDAKNEELQDLRTKMMQLTNSMTKINQSNLSTDLVRPQTQTDPNQMMIVAKPNNDDSDNSDIDIGKITTKTKLQPSHQHQQQASPIIKSDSQLQQTNKLILETIIDCLQKCLKQKDEALEEYRLMIEQMRDNYSQNLAACKLKTQDNNDLNGPKFPIDNNNNNGNNLLQLEKIYEDLFVKPKAQENNQLMELLQSTLHQLESIRTKSRERIKQLEMELNAKSRLIEELETKNERLTIQLNSDKEQMRKLESQSKVQEEKIQTLTNKLNDMIRRNQQSVQTASALKKKVENSIFQESADLRSKITELGTEVRRLEVEKWNIEKRLSQERQAAKERLAERDQNIAQLSEQVTKLQSLVAKMEKKILIRKQPVTTKDQSTWKTIKTKDQSIQTVMINNENKSMDRFINKNNIKIERSNAQKTESKKKNIDKQGKEPDQEIQMIKIDEKKVEKIKDQRKKILNQDLESVQSEVDIHIKEKEEEEEEEVEEELEELDSSRQIIIDTLRLEQMSTIMNEIAIVGNEMMKTTTTIATNNNLNVIKSNFHGQDPSLFQTLETLKSSSCSSRDTGSICQECESKFNAHRIEQHLIDLRLERLLDENIRLKLELGSSQRKLTKQIEQDTGRS